MQVLLKSTERLWPTMFRLQMTIKVIAKPSACGFSSFFFKTVIYLQVFNWIHLSFYEWMSSVSGCKMNPKHYWFNPEQLQRWSHGDNLHPFSPFPFLAFAKFWCNFVLSMQERFPFNNFPVMIISVLQSLLNVVEGLKWEKGLICNCSRKFSFSFWTKPNLQYCH